MKKIIFLIFTLLLYIGNIHAQHSPSDIKKILTQDFEELYQKYDFDEASDSILLRVNSYLEKAGKRYQNRPTAEDLCEAAVWHSYKASLLSRILEQQQWTIFSRTQTESANSSDWKTWDITTFEHKILDEFHASLQEKEILMSTPSEDFLQLFEMPNEKQCYPDLYDLLAYRFANHLDNFSSTSMRPAEEFDLNQTAYFDVQLPDFATKDSLSTHFHFLKTLQEIEQKHRNDREPDFRMYNRLVRLKYVWGNCQLENKDELYLAALLILEEGCKSASDIIKQLVYYSLGNFYQERGNKSEKHPDDFITAIGWYEKAIAAAKDTKCANTCTRNVNNIKQAQYLLSLPYEVLYPEENLLCLRTKDYNKLYVSVVNPPEDTDLRHKKNKDLVSINIIKQSEIDILNSNLYRVDTTLTVLPALETGHYLLLASPDKIGSTLPYSDFKKYRREEFYVSRLRLLYTTDSSDLRVLVCDRKTGNPVPDVEVILKAESYRYTNYKQTLRTDAEGSVRFLKEAITQWFENHYFSATITLRKGKDQLPAIPVSIDRDYEPTEHVSGTVYTDRAIYRPGQTIEWKAVILKRSQFSDQLLPNAKIIVQLKDANSTVVQRDTLTTNTFGSIAGNFQIPDNGLLGNYRIEFLHKNKYVTSQSVRVEEYKRPTFEAVMDKPDGTYRLGSEVRINGTATAYAGYAIQGANVTYRIVRNASFPFRPYGWWFHPIPTVSEKEIAHGECITDDDGHFSIVFTADGDPDMNQNLPLYRYTVTATVSDPSGETHEVSTVVPVSQRTLLFDVELPELLRAYRNENHIAVRTNNLAGEPQAAEVRYSVVRLAQPKTYRESAPFNTAGAAEKFGSQFPQYDFEGQTEPYQWEETTLMESGQLTTSATSEVVLKNLSSYPTGSYKLKLNTIDSFGQTVEEEFCFHVSQKESELPFYTALSVTCDKTTAAVGETITFVIGSRLKKQPVYIRIFNNDKLLEEKWIHLDNSTYLFKHIIKRGEEGKFCCYAYTCWENKSYTEEASIQVPETQRQIHFEFTTFRDKLQPGGQETVRIQMTDGSGRPITAAELLCTLYDASLDAFAANYFAQALFTSRKPAPVRLRLPSEYRSYFCSFTGSDPIDYALMLPSWSLSINHLRKNYYISRSAVECSASPLSNMVQGAYFDFGSDYDEATPRMAYKSAGEAAESDVLLEEESVEATSDNGTAQADVPLRSNFQETAFFYPFLTVKDGVVEFEYTVPESLTKWKMLGAAHTTQRQYGTFEKFVVTQKTLMVSPNLPRFVYEGDTWDFAAKVVNMSSERLEGTVELRLLNAEDSTALFSQVQPVTLPAGGSSPVKFTAAIPEGLAGVTYVVKVVASGGGNTYSDGETGDIPVLSRKQIVTEALPLFITKKGSRTFSLQNLPAAGNSILSCKLQFTPDARWNAILALPYLMEYPYDCNEQLFSKLYANTVAAYIVKQNPDFQSLLKNAMDQNPEALRSKLVQNSDLKQILLTETPWVADAMDEDNEIQNISCLFETDNLTEQRKEMVQKLERNQNADGGWNWFSSRYNEKSSRYITQHLLIGSGRLMAKGICKAGDNFLKANTLDKAIRFIDNDVEKDYKEIKQKHPEWLDKEMIGSSELHYLYARSFFLKKNPAKIEAYKFYKSKLVKEAPKLDGIYLKTMAALTLWQCNDKGDRELAKQLMLGIKKRAIRSEEMGMYWKNEGYGWFWYEAPIERQALLIEAFQTILQDEESVKEMKIWLLQQKRTQHWNSTRSTADACYALLLDNDLSHPDPTKHITVSLCGENIDLVDTMQLPMKQDVAACVEKGSNGTVTLTRDTDGLSYGGVFVRYYKDIDEVKGTGRDMPMSVERRLYRVTTGERGEVLTELGADGALQVGDRVRVRMVLRADRDLEFVHLKDLRAAAFEPTETLSGYRWQDGLSYYQSFRDASVNFFFDWLRKGTYVFEYTLFVTQSGEYSSGYASIQCMYAPEFCAHSASSGRIAIRSSR